MTTRLSKTIAGFAAAATLAVSAIAFSSPAQAWWHHHHRWGWGPGFGTVTVYDGYVDSCRLVNIYNKYGHYVRTVKRCG
jgi:hypothetical protein